MSVEGQTSVSIPKALWNSIIQKEGNRWWREFGFRSPTDFIIKAIRDKLEEMEMAEFGERTEQLET